jgi:hypothetical protein
MIKDTLKHIAKNQLVSFLSVLVAVSALVINARHNAAVERHRNIRIAEFEILRNLAELQQMVDSAYFQSSSSQGNKGLILSRILVVRDLAALSPRPVQQTSDRLMTAWRVHGEKIGTSIDAAKGLSDEILYARGEVVTSLRALD